MAKDIHVPARIEGGKIPVKASLGQTVRVPVGSAVNSVNGMTGDVVLTAEDVGALPSDTPIPSTDGFVTKEQFISFLPVDSASGAVASFTDGADNVPLKSLVVGITGTQGGSCNVVACGVNVWDEEWELGSYSTTNGEPATYTDRIRSKNRIDVVPNTEYYFKTTNGLTAGNMYFYDANDVFISARTTRGNNVTTTPGNCRYMRIAMGLPYGATHNHDISINYPSSDHDYHPYAGQSIPISWEPIVRNGTLDVLNGILTDTDTQTEYQIETHEVKSLLGQNNIYADTGDTSVEYRADIKSYINRKIAEAIAALS